MYEVDPLDDLIGPLPDELLQEFEELRAKLAVSPWAIGQPYIATNPTGLRTVTFADGRAMLIYGVLDRESRVHLVEVLVA